jgi:23S rRNA maturation mini-RNase III
MNAYETPHGYLYLTDERERLREIAAEAVRIVDVQSKRAAMQTNAGRK